MGLAKRLILMIFLLVCCLPALGEQSLAHKIVASYAGINTISCDIRRNWQGPDGKVRMNSRVHWRRPSKLHVENYSPLQRRYVCDGEHFYYYVKDDPRGFSRSVEDLDDEWLLRLAVVPGTALEHLLPLLDVSEDILEPDPSVPDLIRRGYPLNEGYVVLYGDAAGRLARLERFAQYPADKTPQIRIVYDSYEEIMPDVWLPLLHKTTVWRDGNEHQETLRVSMMEINHPLAENLFDATLFFDNVEFVDSFDKIYKH